MNFGDFLISDSIKKLGFEIISIGDDRLLEFFLGILECGLKIVKSGFQFYTFREEIAIGKRDVGEDDILTFSANLPN